MEDIRHVKMQVRRMDMRRKVVLDRCWQVQMVERKSRSGFIRSLHEREVVLTMVEYSVEVCTVANEGGSCPYGRGDEHDYRAGSVHQKREETHHESAKERSHNSEHLPKRRTVCRISLQLRVQVKCQKAPDSEGISCSPARKSIHLIS